MSLSYTNMTNWQSLYKVSATDRTDLRPVDLFAVLTNHNSLFVPDYIQCSVHQGQSAPAASVHSALSRRQRRVLRRPPLHRFPHQPNSEMLTLTSAQLQIDKLLFTDSS